MAQPLNAARTVFREIRAVCEVLGGSPIGEVAVRYGITCLQLARPPEEVAPAGPAALRRCREVQRAVLPSAPQRSGSVHARSR